MFGEKEDDIGLLIVYEAMSRKEFEDLESFIPFTDNNSLDTSDKFGRLRSLYDVINKNLEQIVFSILFSKLTNK